MSKTFTFFVVLIYILSCNTVRNSNPNATLNRVWMLTSYKKYSKEFLTSKEAFLDLSKPDNASAKMGCNSLGFPFTIIDTSKIKFSNGLATLMACPDMNLEDDFSKELPSFNSYSIDGHKLILENSKGEKMEFVAQDWD